ncbi:uncharacterized protein LOC129906243 [Episyrphus balteatus]|uniref:uncharacterized protein LOC129906243 n=1 Tax=Episyrphus balteatus TaxID=286459 RepID=UPI0024868FED|nr:uncharacterized protein LOC129906243 [Episyrphus balteatus]
MENLNVIFEEQLIALIKDKEFLYNTKLKEYKNVNQRNMAWDAIAKELGRTVGECRQPWKSLRDRFIKEKRKMEAPSGSAADQGAVWEFFDSLQFLSDSIQTRRQIGNFCSAPETPDSQSPLLGEGGFFGEEFERTPTPKNSRKWRRSSDFNTFFGGIQKIVMELATPSSIASTPRDIDEEFMVNMARRMQPLNVAAKMRLQTKIMEEINKELLANLEQ